jgi:hypothetical protein
MKTISRKLIVCGLVLLIFSQASKAKSIWVSFDDRIGLALVSGWDVRYQLGATQMGIEAQISLLLVYNPTKEEAGLFGKQWRCPRFGEKVRNSKRWLVRMV